jgi:hypothetical protein
VERFAKAIPNKNKAVIDNVADALRKAGLK